VKRLDILTLALWSVLGATPAKADIVVTLDEFGNGVVSINGDVTVVKGVKAADTTFTPNDPNLKGDPLVYDFSKFNYGGPIAYPNWFAGDVLVTDQKGGNVTDLFRFTADPAFHIFKIIVYSDVETPDDEHTLADVGVPGASSRQTNQTDLMLETSPEDDPRINGLFDYVPQGSTGPGYIPGGGVPHQSYNFISDGAIPEPAALTLGILMTVSGLVLSRIRRPGDPA
jgi:hypothetical protein